MLPLPTRIAALDWLQIASDLNSTGYARAGRLLSPRECLTLRRMYADEQRFRSHIQMRRHGFGSGEYKYFSYPLPRDVGVLRHHLYARLQPVANDWQERLGRVGRFPAKHAAFLDDCRAAGQVRPTPLLLRYGAGDFNRLHQDVYGELTFPLQVAVLLSDPTEEFTGGELVLTEQRPHMQSRATVVPLQRGDCVIFAVNERPVAGVRSTYRVRMRHGVSEIRSGNRFTLGIIFHDAA